MNKFIFGLLLVSGCQTVGEVFPAKDVIHSGNIHTIEFSAAEWSEGAYVANFEAGAEKACGSKSYKVLEKSKEPSTIKDAPGLKGLGRYFWVVECQKVAH